MAATRADPRAMPAGRRPAGGPGGVRIIGGRWRGRRLPVPVAAGLRPTPDRVRETLFNWLAPVLPGSRCLDCFAGSGALGLEAASRGAARVVLLEQASALADGLSANLARLGDTAGIVVTRTDALHWLARPPDERFDIAFLDPPFAAGLLAPAIAALANGWLADGALIYLETDRRNPWPRLPQGWAVHREQTAGDVRYGLMRT